MKIQKVSILKFDTSDIFLEQKYNLKVTYEDNTSRVYSYSTRSISTQIGLLDLNNESKAEMSDGELRIYTQKHFVTFHGLAMVIAAKEGVLFKYDYAKYHYATINNYSQLFGRRS